MVSALEFEGRQTGSDVRFGSKADIGGRPDHVRFTPESGHGLAGL
jgi:hypothetical protein